MPQELNKYGLTRRPPAEVRRQIRQECNFGCVCCGLAIAQYEHIDPEFHEAKEHDPAKMAYLCGGCHDRVTRGVWSKAKVKADRKQPWAKQKGHCHDAFDIGADFPVV